MLTKICRAMCRGAIPGLVACYHIVVWTLRTWTRKQNYSRSPTYTELHEAGEQKEPVKAETPIMFFFFNKNVGFGVMPLWVSSADVLNRGNFLPH